LIASGLFSSRAPTTLEALVGRRLAGHRVLKVLHRTDATGLDRELTRFTAEEAEAARAAKQRADHERATQQSEIRAANLKTRNEAATVERARRKAEVPRDLRGEAFDALYVHIW